MGIPGVLDFRIHGDTFRYIVAAVYFANARYFEHAPNTGENYFIYVNPNIASASHSEIGAFRHYITLPLTSFSGGAEFLRSCDAETRHAVHQNLLNAQGLFECNLAERASHVIGETIDQGAATAGISELSPQIDPFLVDFHMTNEKDGHNGAGYLSQALKFDQELKRMQMFWLSRLPIRLKSEQRRSLNDVITECRMINRLSAESAAKKKPDVYSGWVIRRDIIKSVPRIPSLYDDGLSPLVRFYAAGILQRDCQDPTLKKIEEIRRNSIRLFPYEVDTSNGVFLNGRLHTRFASQLDYVALKLLTTKPRALYEEAKETYKPKDVPLAVSPSFN